MRVPDESFIAESRLRPEISQSWRRSLRSGLRPDASLDLTPRDDFDRRGRLLIAAAPVLDQVAQELDGTGFGILLADCRARIVARRFGGTSLESAFDRAGVVVGSQFLEETTGTNSIATVFELRRGVTVLGEEHYIESLKTFSCYGHPLISRMTGRLEGVLDISCPAELSNPLLAPFLTRAAREIEQRLLHGAREAEQRLLSAYQNASIGGRRAVAALNEGVVMASAAAMELLSPSDHAVLRGIAGELPSRGRSARREVELSSGRTVVADFRPVPGTGGILVEIHDPAEPRTAVPRGRKERTSTEQTRDFERYRTARRPVLVSGEPGSGRTSTAAALTEGLVVRRLDAVELVRTGTADLAARLTADDGADVVLVEDIQLLPPELVVQAARLLRPPAGHGGPWTVLTSAPVPRLPSEPAALAARCLTRIELPPLRARCEELPSLIVELVRRLRPDARLRFTPGTLEALAAHPWPGNLHELREVLLHVLDHRSAGDVTPRDLPPALRVAPRVRRLSMLERAEYETIVAALRDCADNKVHTARRLGMSRATLYRRMRALGIDGNATAAPPAPAPGTVSQIATVTGR
ncbi:transcriptional regulator [Streptomyces sp. SKN60]|uniref:sigma-54-dependent Fis family transcriptional regulator n=1 Tax=Streptomyces sp. SKN60 TaxID=2855506 RepID=UPI002244FFEA|nr:helix-turn-helix domain-containing protein [Streptomyces sp. SKN60]MCX2184586.1 transcriptional regulator [Streptomyces sp. SKN60]